MSVKGQAIIGRDRAFNATSRIHENVYKFLYDEGGQTPQQLAVEFEMSKDNARRIMNDLEAEGRVKRALVPGKKQMFYWYVPADESELASYP